MAKKSDSTLDSPRVRFNWGFHDAQHDAERAMPKRDMATHFDREYAAGYVQGHAAWQISPVRAESSEPAWLSHCAVVAADKARRAALKNATPSRTDLRV